jgi:hypothetical protein
LRKNHCFDCQFVTIRPLSGRLLNIHASIKK